jgi:tRNA-2-methylthio-N6-dimethylallyladenosine synthase
MTDHIVVFEGNERLIGQTVPVHIAEATAFTLFGTVITGEQVGVESERFVQEADYSLPEKGNRVSLPLI